MYIYQIKKIDTYKCCHVFFVLYIKSPYYSTQVILDPLFSPMDCSTLYILHYLVVAIIAMSTVILYSTKRDIKNKKEIAVAIALVDFFIIFIAGRELLLGPMCKKTDEDKEG